MKPYLYRSSNLKYTIDFSGFSFMAEISFWQLLKNVISCALGIKCLDLNCPLSEVSLYILHRCTI